VISNNNPMTKHFENPKITINKSQNPLKRIWNQNHKSENDLKSRSQIMLFQILSITARKYLT